MTLQYFVAVLNVELRVKAADSDPEFLDPDAALRRDIHLEDIAEAGEGNISSRIAGPGELFNSDFRACARSPRW